METVVGSVKRLHWLGHATFRLDGPPTIYFDPYKLKGRPPLADLILITHDHYDHCVPDDVKGISGPDTIVVGSPSVAKKLHADVRTLRPGEEVTVKGIRIEAVPAYNLTKRYHPRAAEYVGFVVTSSGERLYFAGDTDRIMEMREIRCDVALLPVGGTYTMDVEEAALAAADIGPRIAVPMHYGERGIGTAADGERFRSLYRGETVILLEE